MEQRRTRSERGAVAAIVATLLVVGVVFGFLTIAVDYGQLMYERAQQQNSADASALSLARSCATGAATCVPGANSLSSINNANSFDNQNAFESQCGGVLGSPSTTLGSLPVCGTVASVEAAGWTNCPPVPAQYQASQYNGTPFVEVRTKTQASGLRNWFASIAGGSGRSWVGACSRAAKAAAGGAGAGDIPIAISACEWRRATAGNDGGGGGSYVAPPNYVANPGTVTQSGRTYTTGYGAGGPAWPAGAQPAPAVNAGRENVFLVQNPPGGQTPPSTCPSWQGHAMPGGFGILSTIPADSCKIDLKPDFWVQTSPGNNVSCDLTRYVGKVVSVPVFDCTSTSDPGVSAPLPADCGAGNGSNAWYHVLTMAKFYLSGYGVVTSGGIPNSVNSINPNSNSTLPNSANPCANSETCIAGWFTTGAGGGPPAPPGQDFGVWTVTPIG